MSDSFRIHLSNLNKHYGSRRVFDAVSLDHSDGVLGIGGANGSGKSTLLKCLAGLEAANSGSIQWKQAGQSIEMKALKKHLGYAAPYINLYDQLSCIENLEFLLNLRNTPDNQTAHPLLNRVGLQDVEHQSFNRLSTGQKQRLRLAAALIHHPKILFLDEPGANLDEAGQKLIAKLIADFKQAGKLVFVASNNPQELALCDRVFSVEKEDFL